MNTDKFSLIMATLNRKNEVDSMLLSLSKQTYKNFELVIVDQNPKGYLDDIIKKYKNIIDLKHIRINEKGLSKARNIGLKYISGDIIGFPDDDCQYQNNTLENIIKNFRDKNIDILTGTIVRNIKEKTSNNIRKVNIYNVWTRGISFTMFFRKKAIAIIGAFDEKLGVGSGTIYGSGEETDYLIRGIKKGCSIYNTDSVKIFHPKENFNNKNIHQKAYSYSVGRMYVLKKHQYNKFFIYLNIVYPLIKYCLFCISPMKRKYYWAQFIGRCGSSNII